MSKLSLCLVSLIAAIPGGILAALLVKVFLDYGGGPSPAYQGLAGVVLLISAMMTLMPIGILLFGGRKQDAAPAVTRQGAAESADDLESADEFEELGSADDLESADEFGDEFSSEDDLVAEDSSEFDDEFGDDLWDDDEKK